MARTQPPKNIDEYIARFPADLRAILQQVRTTIGTVAPEATETISYSPFRIFDHDPVFGPQTMPSQGRKIRLRVWFGPAPII